MNELDFARNEIAKLHDDIHELTEERDELRATIERMEQLVQGVPKCPYPCGWRNLLKHAIKDGAYLARQINEDEPVTGNARAVTMRMVMRLRDVLLVMNSATPEAKP